ncbi:MAG: FGGY-family carbohydrate kinase [Sphaerochaetaceae bacterium]|nr:FGGY-family carbohydrate kinase [Sphaerochaetaceae bacterium]
MEYWIGLDLGTSVIKGVALGEKGDIIGQTKLSIEFESNTPGVKEINPHGYVKQVYEIIKKLIIPGRVLKSIAWAAASGNLVLVGEDEQPISPIYSWLDQRPNDGSINDIVATLPLTNIHATVGWPFVPQFPLGRLIWLWRNQPNLMKSTRRICMSNDYLTLKMTGQWVVDESTATTMYLYDQIEGTKSQKLIELARIEDSNKIPPIVPSGTRVGVLSDEICDEIGIPRNSCDFVLGSFDHPSAARAVHLERTDQLLLSCGTSWVGCIILEDRNEGLSKALLIDPFQKSIGGKWLGMFSVAGIGSIFDQWVHALLDLANISTSYPYKTFDELAIKGSSAGLPTINLQVEDIRSKVKDLLSKHAIGDVARAILEEIVFSLKLLMEMKEIDLLAINEILLVGGPTESPLWPQIIADVCNKKVLIRFGQNAGAVGAAMIASERQIRPKDEEKVLIPDEKQSNNMRDRYESYRRVYRENDKS